MVDDTALIVAALVDGEPGSQHHRRLDVYRKPLQSLARTVETMLV